MGSAKTEILYARYNSTRRPEFRITTEICENEGNRFVRKRAAGEAAHRNRNTTYAKLMMIVTIRLNVFISQPPKR